MYKITYEKSAIEYISLVIDTKEIKNPAVLTKIQEISKGSKVVSVSLPLINFVIYYYKQYVIGIYCKNVKILFLHGVWPALEIIDFLGVNVIGFNINANNLVEICANDCSFDSITKWNFPKVKKISIAYSDLKFVDANLPEIEKLELDSCKLFIISGYMPKLEYLDICSNNISDTEFINQYKNLRILNLEDCKHIKHIKFTELKKLKDLFIEDTKITNFLPIKELISLNFIDLPEKMFGRREIKEKHIDSSYKTLIIPKLPGVISDLINFYYKRMKLKFDLKNNRILNYIYK